MERDARRSESTVRINYSNHIHITGPARTGTTLMKNLMHCFEETFVVPGEKPPTSSLATAKIKENPAVRPVTKLPGGGVELYEKFPGINVICMCRDPRDMFCSSRRNNHVAPGTIRWWVNNERTNPGGFASSIDGYIKMLKDPRTLAIKYEDLVANPNELQDLIANNYSLSPNHLFSRGHEKFLPEKTDNINFAMNGIRPPDTASIGSWKLDTNIGLVKEWISKYPTIQEFIEEFGYERD